MTIDQIKKLKEESTKGPWSVESEDGKYYASTRKAFQPPHLVEETAKEADGAALAYSHV